MLAVPDDPREHPHQRPSFEFGDAALPRGEPISDSSRHMAGVIRQYADTLTSFPPLPTIDAWERLARQPLLYGVGSVVMLAIHISEDADIRTLTDNVLHNATAIGSPGSSDAPLVIPWINYQESSIRGSRLPQQNAQRAQLLAQTVGHALQEAGHTARVLTDRELPGTPISMVRKRAHDAVLPLVVHGLEHASSAERRRIVGLPILWLDSDVRIANNSGNIGEFLTEFHSSFAAPFLTGNLRYADISSRQLFDYPPDMLQAQPDVLKALYLIEQLRIMMLESQPPTASRGYVPEAFVTMRVDTLFGLGGVEPYDKSNESWHLLRKSVAALQRQSGVVLPSQRTELGALPTMAPEFLHRAKGLVMYDQKLNYNTSGRGLIEHALRSGPDAISLFDDHIHYRLFSEQAPTDDYAYAGMTLAVDDLKAVLAKAYEHFLQRSAHVKTDGTLDFLDIAFSDEQTRSFKQLVSSIFGERYTAAALAALNRSPPSN